MNIGPQPHRVLWRGGLGLAGVLLAFLIVAPPSVISAPPAQATPTGILAEAIGEANLRAGPGVEYDVIGVIHNGTQYPVLGQHELYPWLLVEYPGSPDGRAWVFADLMTLTAPREAVPYLSDTALISAPSPSPSATVIDAPANPSGPGSVYIEALGETNVRFGPGIDYPRVGRVAAGERHTVVSRHALFPWLLIDFPGAPDGVGWVFADAVEVFGDVYTLPVITVEEVAWPTLTPTPPFVVTSAPPWQIGTPAPVFNPDGVGHVDMAALGQQVLALLLDRSFAPEEDRFGSVFVLDLATGANFSLGSDIAYSGMSLIKIPILVEYYRMFYQPPDAREATLIANTMICSGNHTANEMLTIIGQGEPFAGAERVTATMRALGLENTFILTPFVIGDEPVTSPPGYVIQSPQTNADQVRALPDPYNQTTPEDLGWLLNAVYQCAMNETGPLLAVFPDQFTPTECRQVLLTMSANQINVLTEAGVPEGTRVAHKHGWIDDTHGDAAIVFTPGGDFVLTMAVHQPEWLPYELSWPTMAEIARMVYNAYNPDAPLAEIHPSTVDETCELSGHPLLSILSSPFIAPLE